MEIRPYAVLSVMALLVAGMTTPALAQQPAAAHAFDVVSIKLYVPAAGQPIWAFQPTVHFGRWEVRGATLGQLVHRAYNRPNRPSVPDSVSGLPPWNNKTKFDIQAQTSAATLPEATFESMLQSMLRDRFHLVAHVETKPGPAYVITAPQGDIKLPPAEGDCVSLAHTLSSGQAYCGVVNSAATLAEAMSAIRPDNKGYRHMKGRSLTVEDLADYLGGSFVKPEGLPVVDDTGITRTFDLDVAYMWYPMPEGGETGWYDAWLATNFGMFQKALLQQFGLNLSVKPTKVPLPTVVIDSVTLPTPN